MKVSELMKVLQDCPPDHQVMTMRVERGIPYAKPLTLCWTAEEYDGEIVWVDFGAERGPDWMNPSPSQKCGQEET
jgi:hypothetical protein